MDKKEKDRKIAALLVEHSMNGKGTKLTKKPKQIKFRA